MTRHTYCPIRPRHIVPFVVMAAMATSLTAAGPKQKQTDDQNPGDSIEATIFSIDKKGRSTILAVEDENGEKTEHRLNSKTPLQVTGPADSGFLRPGAVVYTKVFVKPNKPKPNNLRNRNLRNPSQQELLFGNSFTVYLDGLRTRGWKPGKTKEVKELVGQIVQKSDDKLLLSLGRAGRGIVTLEKGYKVDVVSSNPQLIQAGAKAILHGESVRGQFRVSAVEVKLEKPLDSKEYFAPEKENNKGRKRTGGKNRSDVTESTETKKEEGQERSSENTPVQQPSAQSDKNNAAESGTESEK